MPVGFDYDQLIAPLVREKLDVDRAILLVGAVGSEANVEYSKRIADELEQDFRNLLGAEIEQFVVGDAVSTSLAEYDERGTTVGVTESDGSHVVEFPVASFQSVEPFEERILFKLGEDGEFDSVAELTNALADELDEPCSDSFRSKVIYNVDRLGPGGRDYVELGARGKSNRTRFSRIGEL